MRGKSLTCRRDPSLSQGLRPTLQNFFLAKVDMMLSVRLTISKDDPCLFITAVARDRLPVFRTEAIKSITCEAIDEARTSCGFLSFAYVIMPAHFHLPTDRPREPSR